MNFFLKMMLKKQLKGVPDAEIDKLLAVVESNPDFFKKVAEQVEEKTKLGMSQQDAVMSVIQKQGNKEELKKVMGGIEVK